MIEKPVCSARGWVFYDADCAFCVRGAMRCGGFFARHGFHWLPLQTPGTTERLKVDKAALREEMKLLLADGCVVGGVDAWVILCRAVWWLWPLGFFLALPGIHWFAGCVYRWIARHRHCFGGYRKNSIHHRHGTFFEMP